MKKNKKEEEVLTPMTSTPEVQTQEAPATVVAPVELPVKSAKLSQDDKVTLDLAKAKRDVAVAQAEKMVAQSETADVSFKYLVLQIYMKYNLTEKDGIDEAGNIIYGNYQ
jgi:hypothetical protein